ncbi:MAG TPA: right-handed parallel beta-helix repeat-containing protein [Acetobacteraceae bacterium]|nr:right-handed parallel beta-helix repeat-containing protein [Acetobacteraceae bacterium]
MTNRRSAAALSLMMSLAACATGLGGGNVLDVGPSQRLKLPSQAAAAARPGDIIRIAPGDYTDCAVWRTSKLTIEATGEGATLADKTCADKAIFVITGNDITVRNLTFARASVPDANGAGIRAEGRNLTIEHSMFIDNENGILANTVPGSTIRIVDSEFRGNGKCDEQCAHGIYVNVIDRLEIEHSRFIDQHVGHHIKSRARNTVLIDNDIADGPNGNSSYLVDIPNGGDVLMQGNRLQKGKLTENQGTAVPIGEEGVKNPTHELIIRDNDFTSDLPAPTVFVRNGTAVPATLSGNHLQSRITPLVGPGTVTP